MIRPVSLHCWQSSVIVYCQHFPTVARDCGDCQRLAVFAGECLQLPQSDGGCWRMPVFAGIIDSIARDCGDWRYLLEKNAGECRRLPVLAGIIDTSKPV